jgi:integrase
MKVAFSKQVVLSLPIGTHTDTKVTGLVCTVTNSSRRFGVYLSVHGKPVRRSIGNAFDWSVEAARLEAQTMISELRKAPATAKEKAKATTLGQAIELYGEYLVTQAVKHPDYVTKFLTRYWSAYFDRRLDDLSPLELTKEYGTIVKTRGKATGYQAVKVLRVVFNYAMGLELTASNPAKLVKTASCKSREVYLDESEIAKLREALAEMAPNPRHFFLLALLTGLRRSNIVRMQWSWIKGDTVVIPASESKNAERMEIPLVPEALKILDGRRSLDPVYVFPSSHRPGNPVHNVYEWLLELRRKLKVRGVEKVFTIHDLRRSYAVRLVDAGASLPVIAQARGHRSVSSTPIYARVSTETVRSALARVGQ